MWVKAKPKTQKKESLIPKEYYIAYQKVSGREEGDHGNLKTEKVSF